MRLWTLSLILAVGCDLPGKPDRSRGAAPQGDLADFDRLFAQHCAGCHGADGNLGPAPPLNDPIFLAIVPDKELSAAIEDGRPGTEMPAFARRHGGPLTNKQLEILAAGIKPRWQAGTALSHDPPPYWPGTDDVRTADAVRGRRVFARACAACHGEQGQGGALAGAIDSPDFLRLFSDQVLRRIIITGRPDLGMPDSSSGDGRGADFEPLSSRDVGDLVELLAQWRQRSSERVSKTANAGVPPNSSQD